MENIIYTVNLDFTDNGCVDTGWRLKQGDYGNSKIVVKLSNNGDLFYDGNISPQITFKRADGNSVVSWMTADASYQGYNYIIIGNELEIPGSVIMDLKVIDSEGRTSTASCKFFCVQNPEGYDPEGAHTYVNSDLVETIKGYVGAAYDAMNEAAFSAIDAKNDELDSEAWAVGTRDGDPVPSTDPAYHNNSKWWSEQSGSSRLVSLEDVEIDNALQFQALLYDSVVQKWKNDSLGLINLEQYGYQIGLKGSGGIPFGAISLPHDPDKANENQIAFVNEDSSSILPVQEAVRAFSKGEHFMQRGYFCTALTDIAQFETLVRNTNYKREKVADYLSSEDITDDFSWNTSVMSFAHCSASRYGNIITINVRFTITDASVNNLPIITGIANKYMPLSGWLFGNVVGEWSGAVKSVVIYRLSSDNKLYFPNTTGISNGDKFVGTFTYICNGV